ncbi:DegQ family serine endoprotease [Mesorhizobium sp. RP14(2022)]|uniref:Probable periplasmic serine endoprotease DegP-like n=1 Tax=Mesorhizobium liriopis TaxID=2953882 RepID=A0ABT1C1F7_9HYPH|nr:DegQ family serine endoprotease [Mesorhizobium liriopis]MCO6048655.1 DegQ family serine endoprotease [Mesorhizobium liriopis]
MSTSPNSLRTRSRLMAAAASVAIAGAIGVGAVTSGALPVQAEPVRVQGNLNVPSFADVVDRVSPAVVSVRVESRATPASDDGNQLGQGLDQLPDNHPLKRFFREFGGPNGQDRQQGRRPQQRAERTQSQGSGFFISEDGYIVTNNHVVDGGTTFTVVTNKGDELTAKLIGTDPRTDLALLKVEAKEKFTYVDFADDSKVRVGDWVMAVGNPFGLGGTVTAGIVSARGRDIGAGPYDDFLQIDAAVNRGNSGGPAFNLNGEVVGVNTAIFSPSGGNVGIAFAIPASTVKEVISDLRQNGSVQRGWLGVQIQPVDKDIADSLGLADAKGALVNEPQEGSPALKAGIKTGDVITKVDGKDVSGPRDLAKQIAAISPDKPVDLTIWRDGKEQVVKVDLGTMPNTDKQASNSRDSGPAQAEPTSLADLGLTVTRADDGRGLVVTDVDPDSAASERGIQPGDVITAVNSNEVNGTSDVTRAIADAEKSGRKAVLMQVQRDDASRFVALPVDKG